MPRVFGGDHPAESNAGAELHDSKARQQRGGTTTARVQERRQKLGSGPHAQTCRLKNRRACKQYSQCKFSRIVCCDRSYPLLAGRCRARTDLCSRIVRRAGCRNP